MSQIHACAARAAFGTAVATYRFMHRMPPIPSSAPLRNQNTINGAANATPHGSPLNYKLMTSVALCVAYATLAVVGCSSSSSNGNAPADDAGTSPLADAEAQPQGDAATSADARAADGGGTDAANDSGNMDGGVASGWQHVFDMTGESDLIDVIESPSGNLVAAGTVGSFGAGGTDGLVARFSPSGDYIWSRALGTTNSDRINAVAGDGAEGVVVVGSSLPSSTVPFVARFDGSGNLMFSENLSAPSAGFPNESTLTLSGVVRMSNGNFALVGQQETRDTTMVGSSVFRGWIGIMSPTGALVAQRRFGDPSANLAFYTVAALGGGDLVVAGYWNLAGLVMRLDSALTVKWRATQYSAANDRGIGLTAILPLPSGDLIVGGTYFQANFNVTVTQMFLQRLTGAGAGVWSRRLDNDNSAVTGLFAAGPNQFVALGYSPNKTDQDAYAAILGNDGFLSSQHSLGLPGEDYLVKGVGSASGTLVAAGYLKGAPYGSMRLARLTSDLPVCDPDAGTRLASVNYATAGAAVAGDFGEAYTVTVSTPGPASANGPATRTPTSVCTP